MALSASLFKDFSATGRITIWYITHYLRKSKMDRMNGKFDKLKSKFTLNYQLSKLKYTNT